MRDVADLAIEQRRIEDLTPYENNSRTHSALQIGQIAASIREFGWTNPILVDGKNGIIAGHGRLLAAKSMDMAEVPVIVLDHLTDDQRRALVIADNQLALNAGWDMDLLASELHALDGLDFDIGLLGFEENALANLLADRNAGQGDPDDIPDPPATAASSPGDVWILGKHRIVCGDSTDPLIVERCLDGARPHLMVTDPPYGVKYDADWRNDAVQAGNGARGAPGGRAVGKVMNDDRADWSEAWKLFPGDVAYVWCTSGPLHCVVHDSLERSGFVARTMIIWAKSHFAIGRGHYHAQFEPCWYAVRKGATAHWQGDRKQSTLWAIDKPQKSETGHSTQKPVECMRRPMLNNSKPGDAIYDPFLGSGTTLIAGDMEDRRVFGCELNPDYVDIICLRFQQFTGEKAVHEDGRTFDEVLLARTGAVPA